MEEPKPNQIQTLQGKWIDMPPSADADLIAACDAVLEALGAVLRRVKGVG